jgi:hypothetical protein
MSIESQTENITITDEIEALNQQGSAELEEGLRQIREEISRGGRVPEARAKIAELEARWPEDTRVQYWARVLAPPVFLPAAAARRRSLPRDRERAWLRENVSKYPGCWLAVFEDRLIAADPDLDVVLAVADQSPEGENALLYQQPGSSKTRIPSNTANLPLHLR